MRELAKQVWKTLWQKEKMVVTRIFFFSNVLYLFNSTFLKADLQMVFNCNLSTAQIYNFKLQLIEFHIKIFHIKNLDIYMRASADYIRDATQLKFICF